MHHILQEIEKRIINDFLDFVILSALNHTHSCSSGYDIIKYIYAKFRFLPSAGTVYANLYAMERNGLLQGTQENRRRVYCLTSKGYLMLQEMERTNDTIQKLFASIFSVKSVIVAQLP